MNWWHPRGTGHGPAGCVRVNGSHHRQSGLIHLGTRAWAGNDTAISIGGGHAEMLAAVVANGTARQALSLERAVHGKTGTTNANALFIGFDDERVVGVWVGRDNREAIGPQATGARAAPPIWIDFMKDVPAGRVRVASLTR